MFLHGASVCEASQLRMGPLTVPGPMAPKMVRDARRTTDYVAKARVTATIVFRGTEIRHVVFIDDL